MLEKIIITNFRCYEKTTINFNGSAILVGKNNAGKSTLIEALKILSTVSRKYKTARFVAPPEWVEDERSKGITPNLVNMNIADHGIFNMYGNPPAIVEGYFTNGTSIKAYVGDELAIFAVIYDDCGIAIKSGAEAKRVDIPTIEVLPQISAVLDNEKVIQKSTVDNNRFTRLASRNFRNQLFYYEDSYPVFKELVESTWETLQVKPVEAYFVDEGRILQFFVRVNNFEAEIGWMGHGLQMWIQSMWFVSQCPRDSIIVLDEPDVYMHADLQRRLVRLLMPKFAQVVIATHSIEIIEEVPSDCIVPIDSRKLELRPIGDEASLQLMTQELNGSLNIDLARMYVSKSFIVWDSDETSRKILSAFQSILYPEDLHPLITLPKAFINGWESWSTVTSLSEIFAQSEMPVDLYCIFDSGFHTKEEIGRLVSQAKDRNIDLHIWSKNEIENFVINAEVIYRYICKNKRRGSISLEDLEAKIEEIVSEMKVDTLTGLTASIQKFLDMEHSEAINRAVKELDIRWNSPYCIISGKNFFNRLSRWTQDCFDLTISARQVVPFFTADEVPDEVARVIIRVMDKVGNKR